MSSLTVVRNSIERIIAQNPHTIVAYVRPTKDNGYGLLIPDISEDPVATELGTARIIRRRIPEPFITNTRTPYDYQDVYYMLCAWDADWLKQDLTFDYYGQRLRTLYPENRVLFGGIVYKSVDLEQVTVNNVESLT